MRLVVELDVDNAWFRDACDDDRLDAVSVADTLRHVAWRIECEALRRRRHELPVDDGWHPIRDGNGNTVGRHGFTREHGDES